MSVHLVRLSCTMINENVQFVEGVSSIKQLREALGLTQQDFAVKLGVTVTSVYRWESGRSDITLTFPQMKKFHREVLEPLKINIHDLPDNLGAPYVEAA